MSLTHVQEHVELIARHEAEFLARRTHSERMIDRLADFVGSLPFISVHLALFALWMLWNTLLPGHHFDPAPFSLLATIVGIEAIVLASIILMRQSRMSRRQDERDHLMLQVLLLTEKEATALLNLQRQVAQQIGLERAANSQEVRDLSRETELEEVAKSIKENLVEIDAAEQALDQETARNEHQPR